MSGDPDESLLDAAARFFERELWESETAGSVRSYLEREGLSEPALRAFGVGYAPGDRDALLAHLRGRGADDARLEAAGLGVRSDRGSLHTPFRSRVMFPVRDRDGRLAGFAGMATNPGPSWPRWLISPETGRYRRGSALFGIDAAGPAIGRSGRVLVLDDPLAVVRAHERGESDVVAVIRSPITREHLELLADTLGVELGEMMLDREHRGAEGGTGTLAVRGDRTEGLDRSRLEPADRERPRVNPAQRQSDAAIVADPERELGAAGHILLNLLRAAIGIGVPVAWVLALDPSDDAPHAATTGFVKALGGVALTYVALVIVASLISARVRARSRARRMRGAWERGATEWQPPAWTYHLFEEVLIGAAIVSVVVCTVLFVAVGGFA